MIVSNGVKCKSRAKARREELCWGLGGGGWGECGNGDGVQSPPDNPTRRMYAADPGVPFMRP